MKEVDDDMVVNKRDNFYYQNDLLKKERKKTKLFCREMIYEKRIKMLKKEKICRLGKDDDGGVSSKVFLSLCFFVFFCFGLNIIIFYLCFNTYING